MHFCATTFRTSPGGARNQPVVEALDEMGERQTAGTEVLADGRPKFTVTDRPRAFRLRQ